MENGFLMFHITKPLILNDNLCLPWCSDSHRVRVKMSRKTSWSKADVSFLFSFLTCGWFSICVWVLDVNSFIAINGFFVNNPCIAGTCVEDGPQLLWRSSKIHSGHVGHVAIVLHGHADFFLFVLSIAEAIFLLLRCFLLSKREETALIENDSSMVLTLSKIHTFIVTVEISPGFYYLG